MKGAPSLLLIILVGLLVVASWGNSFGDDSSECTDVMEESRFADAGELRRLQGVVSGFGLRSTGSEAEQQTIDWIESQLRAMPGMSIRSESIEIQRWQPTPGSPHGPGRSLELAGRLSVTPATGDTAELPTAGAVPYASPTGEEGRTGELVYLPPLTPISSDNARDKIIIRDFPKIVVPLAAFSHFAQYITPDSPAEGVYSRPYLGATRQHDDLIAAGQAGAAGIIWVFNVPREQILGYWDPHHGTHYRVPSVFVGVDEGEKLKSLAAEGASANVAVLAERDVATTRNLIATLPGRSEERIILNTNTDGNTWVQENGIAGLLALADYFARQPIECRPRTLEFMFGAAHLHMSRDGTHLYAAQLDQEFDDGNVAFVFAIEHLGTKEILPAPREGGPGERLEYTGNPETLGWFTGGSATLTTPSIEAVKRRELDRVAVLPGQDLPNSDRVPVHCSLGGIGSSFHSLLIPTLSIISGPWSLWAPAFGEEAIDFERMRKQLLAVGDVILALDEVPREVIAEPYLRQRELRDEGCPTCPSEFPPEMAPGPAG
jgi:hypothetical protein